MGARANDTWRSWGIAALATAVFLVALIFITTGAGGPSAVRHVDDLAQGAAAVLGAVAAWVASRRHQGRIRAGWATMSLAAGLWAAGQAVWCWFELVQHRAAPFPSPADIGYLGFSVAATVGVFLIAVEGVPAGRLRTVVDGLIVAGALLAISWSTALGATVGVGGRLDLSSVVSIAYPVADIVLLTMTVQMLSRVAGSRAAGSRAALFMLGAATVSLALADSSFTYLTALGRYHTGDPLDLGWVGGFGMIAFAALAARPAATEKPSRETSQLIFLPYAVLILAAAVIGSLILAGKPTDSFQNADAVVVVVLVLARQYLTVQENRGLLRSVEAREGQLTHQAFHDHLTGLPNRALFNDRVAHALDHHQMHGRPLAVLYCDLDNFKTINDTLGHRAGDNLLARIAERLRGAVRPGDTLARLGGDEFAILVEGADPLDLGRRIEHLLQEPFILDGRRTTVHVSIGISTVSDQESTPAASLVLSNADIAMYAVKRSGKSGTLLYHPNMRRDGLDDLDLQQSLTEALVNRSVRAVFQPVIDAGTGRVQVVETLARWDRHDRAVPPAVFVHLADYLGLGQLLTDAMLEEGVSQLARWSAMLGHHNLRISVNMSASELGPEARLPERITEVLSRYPVRSDQLVLEITESAVAIDPPVAGQLIGKLSGLGVHIALDDFGTGHSSLSRLQQLHIDYLKLDGAMIHGIDGDPTQALVVRSLMELGRALNMTVIVEGVETVAQLRHLRSIDSPPLLQGFALSPPAVASELTTLLVAGVNLERSAEVEAVAGVLRRG